MTIDSLAKQGREKIHTGLAGIDSQQLKKLRNQQMMRCFRHFDDMEGRLEYVATIRDTVFINDSSSRNINSTWYALESSNDAIVWIAEGSEDDIDYSRLVPLVAKKVRMIICIGHRAESLHRYFDQIVPSVVEVSTMAEATHLALYNKLEKKKVIYSPSCKSNISSHELGSLFIKEVNEL